MSISRAKLFAAAVATSIFLPIASAQSQDVPPVVAPPKEFVDQLLRPNPKLAQAISMAHAMLDFQKRLRPENKNFWDLKVNLDKLPGSEIEKEQAFMNYYIDRYMKFLSIDQSEFLVAHGKQQGVDYIAPLLTQVDKDGWVGELYDRKWINHLIDTVRVEREESARVQLIKEGYAQNIRVRITDQSMAVVRKKATSGDVTPPQRMNETERQIILNSVKAELGIMMGTGDADVSLRLGTLKEDILKLFDGVDATVTTPVPSNKIEVAHNAPPVPAL